MSDDWQPGDLALCIKQGAWARIGNNGPKAGVLYTVRKVDYGPIYKASPTVRLYLEGWPGDCGAHSFAAYRFRKIRPHKADEEDRETIRLLTGKPEQVPA